MSRGGSLTARTGALLAIALAAGVLIGASSGGAVKTAGSARAVAVSLTLPGAAPIEGGASVAGAEAVASGAFRYPEDGSLISVQTFASSASGKAGATVSQAVVDIPEASLFGGEVIVTGVATRARARVEAGAVATDSAGSSVASVTFLGQPILLAGGQSAPLGDWGTIAVEAADAVGSTGQRQIVVRSVRITLTAEHRGYAAGTEITLGTAIAELELEKAAPATIPSAAPTRPTRPAKPAAGTRRDTVRPPAGPAAKETGKPPAFKGPPDLDVAPQLTKNGYVFPIFGEASFSSTLGAARATTGWHRGTDIFAAFGAPVLAIADGTLFSVGYQKIGGYRLWLRDRQGNQFYYAHMAGYAPLTANGREVKAGQVIGFNGNTGDAQGTPFHVHFEVHPVALLPMGYDGVVDPYPYLLAWRRLEDVALTVGAGWAPPVDTAAEAPKPGAILFQSYDISMASGLRPGAVERAARGGFGKGSDMFFDPTKACADCKAPAP